MVCGVPAARVASVAACAVVFLLACANDQQRVGGPPSIVFHADPDSANYGAVDVAPIDAAALKQRGQTTWPELLSVYTGETLPAHSTALPLLGRYSVVGDTLRFTPRFPPVPGQPYIAHYTGHDTLDQVLLVPRAAAAATTVVEQVYPSGDRLPVNLLRMYIHFSAPMATGESMRRVQLLDANRKTVDDAFLVVAQQELWDPEHRRLTLLFDPGRIKRDLRPHEELGLPLREGQNYTLVIDQTWPDANGNRLLHGFEKRFSVGPADRTLPMTSQWRLQAPSVNSRSALIVEFPEPLDRALLERLLTVKHAGGRSVEGTISVENGETRWRFTPDALWQAGNYLIEIGTQLEDLAGNNLRDLFDVDLKAGRSAGVEGATTYLGFTVLRGH